MAQLLRNFTQNIAGIPLAVLCFRLLFVPHTTAGHGISHAIFSHINTCTDMLACRMNDREVRFRPGLCVFFFTFYVDAILKPCWAMYFVTCQCHYKHMYDDDGVVVWAIEKYVFICIQSAAATAAAVLCVAICCCVCCCAAVLLLQQQQCCLLPCLLYTSDAADE